MSWPWGENRLGIDQALDNAQWLQRWLSDLTGRKYPVGAVLVIPHWMVKDSKTGPLMVVSSSLLANRLKDQQVTLDPAQIESVARLLDKVCRDVEY